MPELRQPGRLWLRFVFPKNRMGNLIPARKSRDFLFPKEFICCRLQHGEFFHHEILHGLNGLFGLFFGQARFLLELLNEFLHKVL